MLPTSVPPQPHSPSAIAPGFQQRGSIVAAAPVAGHPGAALSYLVPQPTPMMYQPVMMTPQAQFMAPRDATGKPLVTAVGSQMLGAQPQLMQFVAAAPAPSAMPIQPQQPQQPQQSPITQIDKSVICQQFFATGTCSIGGPNGEGCPYAHIANGEAHPIPDCACEDYLESYCEKNGCKKFHAIPIQLEWLRASATAQGITTYRPQDYQMVRDPGRLWGFGPRRSSGQQAPGHTAAVAPRSNPPGPVALAPQVYVPPLPHCTLTSDPDGLSSTSEHSPTRPTTVPVPQPKISPPPANSIAASPGDDNVTNAPTESRRSSEDVAHLLPFLTGEQQPEDVPLSSGMLSKDDPVAPPGVARLSINGTSVIGEGRVMRDGQEMSNN